MNLDTMMQTEEEFHSVVNLKELYKGDLSDLPSISFNEFNILVNSFVGRRKYISHAGFSLLTYEFQRELQEQLQELSIDTFTEIEAGTGALSIMLNNINIKGKGYTLDPDTGKSNWGMGKSPIFEHARENGLLEFQDIRELKLDHKPDMVVASWIPYEGGDEVIEFFENQEPAHTSEYFMVIGEGYGGCTANDEFHDWLDENYTSVWTSQTYVSFNAIYDRVMIFKRKLAKEANDE